MLLKNSPFLSLLGHRYCIPNLPLWGLLKISLAFHNADSSFGCWVLPVQHWSRTGSPSSSGCDGVSGQGALCFLLHPFCQPGMVFLMPAELGESFVLPTLPTHHVIPKLQNRPDFQINIVTWDNPFFQMQSSIFPWVLPHPLVEPHHAGEFPYIGAPWHRCLPFQWFYFNSVCAWFFRSFSLGRQKTFFIVIGKCFGCIFWKPTCTS